MNPRIGKPPNPPDGGHPQVVSIIEEYVTATGRRRQRTVSLDREQARLRLPSPGPVDHGDWQRIRGALERELGAGVFVVWLAEVQLIARVDGVLLLLACPAQTRSWVASRYGALLERVSARHGRRARLASDSELQLHAALDRGTSPLHQEPLDHDQEAV